MPRTGIDRKGIPMSEEQDQRFKFDAANAAGDVAFVLTLDYTAFNRGMALAAFYNDRGKPED